MAATNAKQDGRTLSLIAGTTVCNARCPFCISKTTPFVGMTPQLEPIDEGRLHKACRKARELGIDTVLITGKGEPTIYPGQISQYLAIVKQYGFSTVELQTNGLLFGEKAEKYDKILREWKAAGLSLISISVVHHENEQNAKAYTPNRQYPDLPSTIANLKALGFAVRLSCTLVKGFIDSVEKALEMAEFAAAHSVDQLTLRKLAVVEKTENKEVSDWTRAHKLEKGAIDALRDFFDSNGRSIAKFFFGAVVYEYGGRRQNVCLTNGCTPKNIETDEIRQLIFFPSGKVITDWRYDTSRESDPLELNWGKEVA